MKIKFLLIFAGVFAAASFANETIDQINKAIKTNNANWQAEENWVTRLSVQEQKLLCGTELIPPQDAEQKLLTLPTIKNLPASLDWRNNNGNWLTSVKDQGSCGSCWDFGATAQVEAWWKIVNDNPDTNINLSEQFILSCADAGSCQGGTSEKALDFYKTNGVPLEDCFPYFANDRISCQEACADWSNQIVTIPGWGFITLAEPIVENIKQAVYRHPVTASYAVYADFYAYGGGVYEHVWGDFADGHSILIVGWDDEKECWICKNSWGPIWGEDGYFRIKWGDSGMGDYMPFVYNNLSESTLQLSEQELNVTLTTGEIFTKNLEIQNRGSDFLEYTLIDYEKPVVFHPENFNAFDNSSWWCGDPQIGGYNNYWLQYLDTPIIDLSNAEYPQLTLQTFWAVEGPAGAEDPWDAWDGANVWISLDGGKNFTVLEPIYPVYTNFSLWAFGDSDQGWDMGPGIPGWTGTSRKWTSALFNLSESKSDSTVIRFAFASDKGFCTIDDSTVIGFFVDEIKIVDNDKEIYSNYGEDIKSMYRQGFGARAADWLSLFHNVGRLSPGETSLIEININAADLFPGEYFGTIHISSNDIKNEMLELPVYLSVKSADYDVAVDWVSFSQDHLVVRRQYSVFAEISNWGVYDAKDFVVNCQIKQNENLVFADSMVVQSLLVDEKKQIEFFSFVPNDAGLVDVKVFVSNFGDMNEKNNITYSQFGATNLVDDFEKPSALWTLKGGWGITDKYKGYESEMAAHVNHGLIPYNSNMDALMIYNYPFKVTITDSVFLSYWIWSYTESEHDICYLEVSQDSTFWTKMDSVSGQSPNYINRHVDITPFLKFDTDNLWFRFHFVSNETNELVGIFIDNISFFASKHGDINTLIKRTENVIITQHQLFPNYPNPFNPTTTISYFVAKPSQVKLSILNLNGQVVRTFEQGHQDAGTYNVLWDGTENASGVYFVGLDIVSDDGKFFKKNQKMLLVK